MQRLLCFLLLGIVLIVSGCGSARKQHEFAYVLDQGENAIVIMSVDPDTGLLTTVGSANTDARVQRQSPFLRQIKACMSRIQVLRTLSTPS